MPTNVVGLAYFTFGNYLVQRAGMVFDVQPVTDLVAFAIDRQRLAFQCVENDQRDQFLGEMVRAIVV
ncbi:hypothetical protein D3C81_1929530 [compost metagenome]